MRRTVLQHREWFDQNQVGNLLTQLAITPSGLPDESTLTRLIGQVSINIWADQVPEFGVTVGAGFVVANLTNVPDPLDPNVAPFPWSYWRVDTLWPGLTTGSQTVRWEFDVRGQRTLVPSSDEHVWFAFRGQDFAANQTVFITTSVVAFYLLPAIEP